MQHGLVGECDFIVTNTPPLPIIQAPIISIVEAKKNDIESGLGQCAAQMVGAQRFNQRHANAIDTIYGCITTGAVLTIVRDRYYINELAVILSNLHTMVAQYLPQESA